MRQKTVTILDSKENQNQKHVSWTAEDIKKLRDDFLMGKRVKAIAHELGRTPTAVTKFLSRAGIKREKKINRTYISTNKKKPLDFVKKAEKSTFYDKTTVDFERILSYLKTKGYSICKMQETIPKLIIENDEIFIVDSMPITKMRLVLLANRLRLEERKNIFEVDEIF